MMLVESIINKFLIVLLILSVLTVLRNGYYFIQALINPNVDKYVIKRDKLFFLALSLSYIIMVIIDKIRL